MRKGSFSILGGDERQTCLAQLLLSDGHEVVCFGMKNAPLPAASLRCALDADYVILPLPLSYGDGWLNMQKEEEPVSLEQLWRQLGQPGQVVLAGAVRLPEREAAARQGVVLLDYFDREEVQVANAIPTAEGAIREAMEAIRATIHGKKCLVMGYGRIGEVLSHRLHGMGASVSVMARRRSDLAWIAAYGWQAIAPEQLEAQLGSFDLIFNTVPVQLLDQKALEKVKNECVLLDLASAPGGMDHTAARELGLHVIVARGLPGKVAPFTAAAVLRDSIYHILQEREEGSL